MPIHVRTFRPCIQYHGMDQAKVTSRNFSFENSQYSIKLQLVDELKPKAAVKS
jgi:hypothetical protein